MRPPIQLGDFFIAEKLASFEFLGPFALALAGSRRLLDFACAIVAAAGVVLLTGTTGTIDPLGVVFALTAAASFVSVVDSYSSNMAPRSPSTAKRRRTSDLMPSSAKWWYPMPRLFTRRSSVLL